MTSRTYFIALGVIGFFTGLLLHIFTYTRAIPPEKKKQLGIVAVLMMIVAAGMAMWPFMVDMAARSPH